MTPAPSRYADWKAPDDDGQLLIWPGVSTLLRQTRDNHRALASASVRIQNIPLNELRRRQRHWIGHTNDEQPLVASGHQTELFHPGVWVKDVLTNAVANRVGGEAWHFGVDTDSPKHLHLRWPGASLPITDDGRLSSAAWSGLLDGPTPAHVDEITSALNEGRAAWDFEPVAGEFLATLKRLAIERPLLCSSLTNAIHQLDWKLGLRHHALLMSPVWHAEPYLVFAYHLLADPVALATR